MRAGATAHTTVTQRDCSQSGLSGTRPKRGQLAPCGVSSADVDCTAHIAVLNQRASYPRQGLHLIFKIRTRLIDTTVDM
jgi:hypothetical protein